MTENFKRHFDAVADDYDEERAEFSKLEAYLILNACGKVNGLKILDIGTGTGIVALEVAKKVGTDGLVIGIDISEGMLQKAKEKAEKQGIKNIKFDKGSFTDIPLKNDYVDMIISSAALHHVPPQDKPKAFIEMWRVLKPNGKLIINDSMYENEDWRSIFINPDLLESHLKKIRFPKERMDMALGLTKSSVGIIGTFRDEYVESVEAIRKYVTEAGFKNIKIKNSYRLLPIHWVLKARK